MEEPTPCKACGCLAKASTYCSCPCHDEQVKPDWFAVFSGSIVLVFLAFWSVMVFGYGWPPFGPWPW